MEKFKELKNLIEEMESDFYKFYQKDNHAAGTRIRHGMQKVKNMANDIRKNIQEIKKK